MGDMEELLDLLDTNDELGIDNELVINSHEIAEKLNKKGYHIKMPHGKNPMAS